jgi:hypothetical protein
LPGAGAHLIESILTVSGALFLAFAVALAVAVDRREGKAAAEPGRLGPERAPRPGGSAAGARHLHLVQD